MENFLKNGTWVQEIAQENDAAKQKGVWQNYIKTEKPNEEQIIWAGIIHGNLMNLVIETIVRRQ